MNDEPKRCAVCHATNHWLGMHQHHLVGRRRKSNARWCTAILCGECHAHYHQGRVKPGFPPLTLPHLLWCKLTEDPLHWSKDKLEHAFCKGLPYPEPLPKEFLEERDRNRTPIYG